MVLVYTLLKVKIIFHFVIMDDIVSLWSCIRMILELPNRTSIPSISSKVASVLKQARLFSEKHLLLTAAESNMVSLHLTHLSHLPNNSDILEECACTPKPMSELNPPASLKHWASLYSNQKEPESIQSRHSKRTQQLDAVFVNLVRLMELHKAPLYHDHRVTIHEDARNEEWRHLEFHEFKSLTELRFKKKDILWTVIGKLVHLKTILHHANFAWSPMDAEHLINEIEMVNSSFGRPLANSENTQIRASLNALKRIITSASDRQGTSPFSSFLPSFFYKSFPTPASPGQIVPE